MSIQKLKKGFTLIELMVVIVIIGILAAIAIPKLFGMSAKAKAQEVGPAVGTWSKLQVAYKMETGKWGDAKAISYKVPGAKDNTPNEGETSNFKYSVAKPTGPEDKPTDSGEWKATSIFAADNCDSGSEWTAIFKTDAADDPDMGMKEKNGKDGCQSLTPNFLKIGKAAAGGSSTSGN